MGESGDRQLRKAYGDILECRRSATQVVLCDDLVQNTFERTDILYRMFGYEFCDALFEEKFSCAGFFLEDRETCLKVGFTDVHDNSPLKSALETRFELSEFFWRTISREDYLFSCLVEDIEDIIEFFLGRLFPCEKLDVVDDKHIDTAVSVAEFVY